MALKQDDHLLIIRCYFYSTLGNESTNKNVFCYFFVFVNHRHFLEGLYIPVSGESGISCSEISLSHNVESGFSTHFS